MNITVIGVGYVGLVTGTCLSEIGNQVTCIDINKDKIDKLNSNVCPIYEPGLEEIIKRNTAAGRLLFTTDIKFAIQTAKIIFIAVGTPTKEDWSTDLTYVLSAAKSIGENLDGHKFIVDKSTVPVGTAEKVKNIISINNKNNYSFDVISNPEFLKEGSAINDFNYPDRIVIGADNNYSFYIMRELYAPLCKDRDKIIEMDIKSAELTKYAANAMLATRISFMNELANISEVLGANIDKVRQGIGSDSRIGNKFLYSGCGYGGSCFPKDIKSIISVSKENGYTPNLLINTESVNEQQKLVICDKINKEFNGDINNKTFAIWGLSFKPNTDDMRESPAIAVINYLTSNGAIVKVYDPKAMLEAKTKYFKDIKTIIYCNDKYSCLESSDGLILLTEWGEFKNPDFSIMSEKLNNKIIFDGRNQYNKTEVKKFNIKYINIGDGTNK